MEDSFVSLGPEHRELALGDPPALRCAHHPVSIGAGHDVGVAALGPAEDVLGLEIAAGPAVVAVELDDVVAQQVLAGRERAEGAAADVLDAWVALDPAPGGV